MRQRNHREDALDKGKGLGKPISIYGNETLSFIAESTQVLFVDGSRLLRDYSRHRSSAALQVNATGGGGVRRQRNELY